MKPKTKRTLRTLSNKPQRDPTIVPGVYTIAEAKVLLMDMYRKDKPFMLWGGTGIGKSDIVEQVADEFDVGLIDLRATLLDPVDVRGLPMVENRKAVWAVPDFFPDVKRDGPEGILFIDEINACSQAMQVTFYQLILNKRVGEYELPPGWRVGAAGNRISDKAGAQRMVTALANRFAHLEVKPDVKTWLLWAEENNINANIQAFIQMKPDLLWKPDVNGKEDEMHAFPTPRSWAMANDFMDVHSGRRGALIATCVGATVANEFMTFVDMDEALPSLEEIIEDPHGAKLPKEASHIYAVINMLSKSTTRENVSVLLQYANRMSAEHCAAYVVNISPNFGDVPAVKRWKNRHEGVRTEDMDDEEDEDDGKPVKKRMRRVSEDNEDY